MSHVKIIVYATLLCVTAACISAKKPNETYASVIPCLHRISETILSHGFDDFLDQNFQSKNKISAQRSILLNAKF